MKMVTLNEIEVECLVDTGADVSILSNFFFDQIPNFHYGGMFVKAARIGKKITCPVGCFSADVALDEETTRHKFVVVQDEDALLELDLISKFNLSLLAEGNKFSSYIPDDTH